MADLNRKMAEGHTVSDLDTVIDEVYGARGEYDTLGDRLDEIDTVIDTAKLGIHYKGEVDYYSNLPTTGVSIGDAYTVKYSGTSGTTPDGTEYVWGTVSGTNQWINFSKDSYTKAEVDVLLTLKQNALSSTQLDAVNSGIDSEKVEQIETNKNNILTIANQSTRYNVLNLSAAENVSASPGITYSILPDGSVHIEADINVTGSALYFEKIPITSNIPYITTGCPSGGGNTTYKVQIYDNETNIANADDTGSGSEPFTITTGKIGYRIRFAVGQYNIVVKPMVISKSLYDSGFTDYQPHALSNAELTAAIQAIQEQLANQ